MISNKKQWTARALFMAWGVLAMGGLFAGGSSGCGDSSGGGGGGGGSGLGGATSVSGSALAANGTDPISGATVFIRGSGAALTVGSKSIVTTTCSAGEVTCPDAPEGSCAVVCSCADGTYVLDTSECPADSDTIEYCKGSFCGSASLDCADTPDTCTADIVGSTVSGSTANIAVVTGAFDEIENVLAKLGFSSVDASGRLDLEAPRSFDIYLGGGSLDFDPLASGLPSSSELFGDLSKMQEYDIIFINCGTDEEPAALTLQALVAEVGKEAAHALYHTAGLKAVSAGLAARIRSYVEGGGTIFATDLAYDFVEQSIPEFMDFEDDGTDPAVAETADIAEQGNGGIVTDATVLDGTMKAFLGAIDANTIDSASAPGFDCATTPSPNGPPTTSLLDSGDIRIGDFLGGWGVMDQKHTGAGADTFVWIEGEVDFGGMTGIVRPLTASKRVGDGCVLYSSYHTSHSCESTGFWPQERVLQYLVFETAGSCVP